MEYLAFSARMSVMLHAWHPDPMHVPVLIRVLEVHSSELISEALTQSFAHRASRPENRCVCSDLMGTPYSLRWKICIESIAVLAPSICAPFHQATREMCSLWWQNFNRLCTQLCALSPTQGGYNRQQLPSAHFTTSHQHPPSAWYKLGHGTAHCSSVLQP